MSTVRHVPSKPGKPVCIVQPTKTDDVLQSESEKGNADSFRRLEPERENNDDFNPLEHERHQRNAYEGISYEGLPEGSPPAQVLHCIQLLEHASCCREGLGECEEGEECTRTKLVVEHHAACRRRGGTCKICPQLLALYRNHSERCRATKGTCPVAYCKNEKVKNEYQYVVKKLSEAMSLPTKLQKLKGIHRLLETNRQVTRHILRRILEEKQKSLHLRNSRVINANLLSSAFHCLLTLDVPVKKA